MEAACSETDHHNDNDDECDQDDHDETVTKRISIPMTLPLPWPRTGGFIQIFTHNLLPHNFIRIPTHNSPLSHTPDLADHHRVSETNNIESHKNRP